MAKKKELNIIKKTLFTDQEETVEPDGTKATSKIKLKSPKQNDDRVVYFTIGDPVSLTNLPDPENFNPGRFIANIILDKDELIDPPVQISIEITAADVQRAAGQNIKLAYHQGQKWVVWGQFAPQAGFVTVELAKRGDPAIGVSP